MKKTNWRVTPPWQNTLFENTFGSLDKVFQLEGKQITKDSLSDVILFQLNNTRFYIKRYIIAGKGLRRYLGKSRIRYEWENLFFFRQLGIGTVNIVAHGEQRICGIFQKGALITQEQINTSDLDQLAQQQHPFLQNPQWVANAITQIATFTKLLHDQRFIHTDLKWRNILVTLDKQPEITFIDCPSGFQWPSWDLFRKVIERGIIKDLACLDKTAKKTLNQTQRMSFYKQYANVQKLTLKHKEQIRRILQFFEGRE